MVDVALISRKEHRVTRSGEPILVDRNRANLAGVEDNGATLVDPRVGVVRVAKVGQLDLDGVVTVPAEQEREDFGLVELEAWS